MKNALLFAAASLLPVLGWAQLPPYAIAPLHDHLLEVNVEWRAMDASLMDRTTMVHFNNEAERIATHLHLVKDLLNERTPEGLSANQMEGRMALLDDLDAYADNGIFPQNYVTDHRGPIFIDPHNTACAVGHLMIASGGEDLAIYVSEQMNQAYVHDMNLPAIADWSIDHGLTADELAWIQPGYPPNTSWTAPGGGTDGHVTAMYNNGNTDLLVAGQFANAGNTPATGIAFWDGTSYTALGNGVDGVVHDMISFNGLLYAGGQFQQGLYDLAIWNGSNWSYDNAFLGMSPKINDLIEYNGMLVAAGEASGFAGVTFSVAQWTGNGWQTLGSSFDDQVLTLAIHNNQLVAGGYFQQVWNTTTISAMSVAIYSDFLNEWGQLANGLNAPVRKLTNIYGTLYAGGDMDSTGTLFGLASLLTAGTIWSMELPGYNNSMTAMNSEFHISSIQLVDQDVYVAGAFDLSWLVGIYGQNVARLNTTGHFLDALALMNGPVNSLSSVGNILYAGGTFDEINFQLNPYISSTDLSVGIDEGQVQQVRLVVVPQGNTLLVFAPEFDLKEGTISLYDANGKLALTHAVTSDRVSMDITRLAKGHYSVSLSGRDGVIGSTAFVRE